MALSGPQYAKSLVAELALVADSIRSLNDEFGLRPYVVRILTQRWTGFRVGNGTPMIMSELTLEPTPNVPKLRLGIKFDLAGSEEEHELTVSEISIRYTADQLGGYGPDGSVDTAVEVYYEIEKYQLDGSPSDKRRYEVSRAPFWDPSALGWVVGLQRARGDRDRSGAPHR